MNPQGTLQPLTQAHPLRCWLPAHPLLLHRLRVLRLVSLRPQDGNMQQLIRGALRGIKSERATYCRRAALHLLQHADLRQPAAPVGMMYLIWHPGHAQRAGSRKCNLQHVGRLRSRRRRRPSGLRIRAWPAHARRLRRTRGRSRPAAARCCAVLLPHHLQEPDLAVLRHKRIDFRKLGGVVRCLRAAAFLLRAVQ